jgi:exopolyphosphatase/guanosine-5'-triphosphate,3'-diphosphate pyrophosphatase
VVGTEVTRVAAYDIGTNTVRVLVADASGPLHRDQRVVRLGEGVDATGRFRAEAIERALGGLAELVEAAGPVDVADAVATSASRDASNRDEFLDGAERVLGVRPRVIPGEEEARLSFRGATGGIDRRVAVVDIGGGSTEVVVGAGTPDVAFSVDVGSVRLTERVLPERPAASHRVDAAIAWAEDRLAAAEVPRVDDVLGVGGTFTALAAIDAGLDEFDESVVHGWELGRQSLEALVTWLASLDIAETEAIPSLDPLRASVLLGGAVTALAVMRRLGVITVEVRVTDLLDAVAEDLLRT